MLESRILVVDKTTGHPTPAGQNLFVTLSSAEALWQGLEVEEHRFPPGDLLAHRARRYDLALQLSPLTTLTWKVEGQRRSQLVAPGHLSLCAAGAETEHQWHDGVELLLLSLDPVFLAQVAHEVIEPERIEIPNFYGVLDPQLQHIGLALKAELECGAPGGRLLGDTLSTALAIRLTSTYATRPLKADEPRRLLTPYALRCVLEYIEAHLDQNLSLSCLAAQTDLSSYYFARGFKQSTGVAPHQYVIGRRVERAKLLLMHSDLPLSQIAAAVGFADQSHLVRHFKRLIGVTPGWMKKNARTCK